ncbi:hypothetical protein BKA65DRAFT_542471 [Rhexocercosporidium sp. MPI-PUGE-AT-0058]|nr:hypothetical protein BKA65DRAFT_542471 [Rhexocercosporidium sp. MPI-PUGE-AT-0058]
MVLTPQSPTEEEKRRIEEAKIEREAQSHEIEMRKVEKESHVSERAESCTMCWMKSRQCNREPGGPCLSYKLARPSQPAASVAPIEFVKREDSLLPTTYRKEPTTIYCTVVRSQSQETVFELVYTGYLSKDNVALMKLLDTRIGAEFPCAIRPSSGEFHFVPLALIATSYLHFVFRWKFKSNSERILEAALEYLILGRLIELVELVLRNIRLLPTDQGTKDGYAAAVILNCQISTVWEEYVMGSVRSDHFRDPRSMPILFWARGVSRELDFHLENGCYQFRDWKGSITGSLKDFCSMPWNPFTVHFVLNPSFESDSEADDMSEKSGGSIFSNNGESEDSQSSTGLTISLSSEIYFLLRDDAILGPHYPLALQHMSHRKFQRVLKKLVKEFCESLMAESQIDLEKKTALFIRARLRYLIVRLTIEMDPNAHTLLSIPQELELEMARPERVEAYLQGMSHEDDVGLVKTPAEKDHLDTSDDEPTGHDERNIDDFVLTNRLKNFLKRSTAWSTLQDRFQKALLQSINLDDSDKKSPNHEQNIPHVVLSWSRDLTTSLLNALRGNLLLAQTYRIEWTCRCGHSGSDEYFETKPGGVADLAKELLKSPAITRANVTNKSPGVFGAFVDGMKNLGVGIRKHLVPQPGKITLPTTQPIQMVASLTASLVTPTCDAQYLLFCTKGPSRRKVATFQHIDLCSTKSDQEFFTYLNQLYLSKRSTFAAFSRKLTAIHFVGFEVRPKSFLDKITHPRVPPVQKKAVEYEWEITTTEPPIGSEWMMHIFDCPADAADDDTCIK